MADIYFDHSVYNPQKQIFRLTNKDLRTFIPHDNLRFQSDLLG